MASSSSSMQTAHRPKAAKPAAGSSSECELVAAVLGTLLVILAFVGFLFKTLFSLEDLGDDIGLYDIAVAIGQIVAVGGICIFAAVGIFVTAFPDPPPRSQSSVVKPEAPKETNIPVEKEQKKWPIEAECLFYQDSRGIEDSDYEPSEEDEGGSDTETEKERQMDDDVIEVWRGITVQRIRMPESNQNERYWNYAGNGESENGSETETETEAETDLEEEVAELWYDSFIAPRQSTPTA